MGRHSANQRHMIHELLCSIAGHIVQYGECSLAVKLLDTIGNGVNRKGISAWLAKNAFVHMGKDGMAVSKNSRKDFIGAHGLEVDARSEHEAQCLKSVPWYELTLKSDDAAIAAVWDSEAKLEQLRKYLAKLEKDAIANGDTALATLMQKTVATINDEKFDVVEVD
jgi:hypothetical protein